VDPLFFFKQKVLISSFLSGIIIKVHLEMPFQSDDEHQSDDEQVECPEKDAPVQRGGRQNEDDDEVGTNLYE
jgi:hypothetical protein